MNDDIEQPLHRIAWRHRISGEVGHSPRPHSPETAAEIAKTLREEIGDDFDVWTEEHSG